MIYLRNVHPKRTVLVPLGAGWARVLRPAVTAELPEQVLHTDAVRTLLLQRMVEIADGNAWNADTRQASASRMDWSRAVAVAEQQEFDRMLADLTPAQDHFWSAAQLEQVRQRLDAGATVRQIAAEYRLTPQGTTQLRKRLGILPLRQRRRPYKRAGQWPEEWVSLLRQRWSEGATGSAIAAELGNGISADSVAAKARYLGIPRRSRPGGDPWPAERVELLHQRRAAGLSSAEIARELGVTKWAVESKVSHLKRGTS